VKAMDSDAPTAEHHDLRLVPATCVGWTVVLCGLCLGSLVAATLGAAGLLAAGVATLRNRSAVVLAMGGVAAAIALVIGTQAWQVEHHPARTAAERGSSATVVVHLRDDPKPVPSPGYGGRQPEPQRVVIHAELEAAEIAGHQWRTGGRVILLAPARDWAGLLPGQRVRATGLLATPGRPDLTVAVLQVRGGPEVLTAPTAVQRVAERLRSGLRLVARALDPEPAGLLPALVVGDTSAMVPTVQADFRTAGLTHLIAVSGTNVVILCGVVLGLARLARLGPRTAVVLAGVALVGFVVLCRPSPSVLRAAVMGGVALLALVLGRGRSAVPALCAAVLVLLVVDPALAADPGFALSVLATGALVLLAPGWVQALRRHGVPPGIAEALAVPAAAHVVTAPVVAGLSGQVSLVAILTNLLSRGGARDSARHARRDRGGGAPRGGGPRGSSGRTGRELAGGRRAPGRCNPRRGGAVAGRNRRRTGAGVDCRGCPARDASSPAACSYPSRVGWRLTGARADKVRLAWLASRGLGDGELRRRTR
jgi:competence protein ComEC